MGAPGSCWEHWKRPPLGAVLALGDGTLAQRLLKSETHSILGFGTLDLISQKPGAAGPLVQSSAPLDWGVGGAGARLFLPPPNLALPPPSLQKLMSWEQQPPELFPR